jgi:NitT/TauT family transport system ATP-binding protein
MNSNFLIELENVDRRFTSPEGKIIQVLDNFSMTVKPGEFCAIVGPTGCEGIDSRVGYVFQTDAVFPWKNVLDNVAVGPLFRGVDKKEAIEKSLDWIKRVGLEGFEYHYPHQLSGGMRKRVALAQTFINSPDILLMDEPFSSLDVQTKLLMQQELLQLWSKHKAAVVFVTHDIEEATILADKVYVLSKRPTKVKKIYNVDIERPRIVTETRYTKKFIEISKSIWNDLSEEVNI